MLHTSNAQKAKFSVGQRLPRQVVVVIPRAAKIIICFRRIKRNAQMKSDGFNFAFLTMNTKCMQSPVLIKRCLSQEQADILMLNRARRIALRVRLERACLPCKVKKAKCNDPIRCTKSTTILCTDAASTRSR